MDYKGSLNDENFDELLNTILSTNNRKTCEVNKTIFKDHHKDSKLEKLEILTYLIPQDYSSDDFFEVQEKYDKIVYNFTTNENTVKIFNQLKEINPYSGLNDLSLIPNISPSNSIENLVESTYAYDPKLKYQMAEEICYVKILYNKWRRIGGDGNCFYRSVMFGYLENLIFDKNILALQRIVTELVEKFDPEYLNTKNLPIEIKDPLLKIDRRLIVTIFRIIIDILDKPGKDSINEALTCLTKSFNFSKVFDMAMILYLRYKLYEFILKNKENYFSQDFPIKLGNLLPFQYETEEGKFLYDNFFKEDLLKLYTYAEKIAIYLTPFVIKMNLRVLFYDYGSDCNIQTKHFTCYLKDKQTLDILYRKAHYDIIYSKIYDQKYFEYIDHFKSLNNKLYIVDDNLISYYMKNEMRSVDLKQSKIFDMKNKLRSLEEKKICDDSKTSIDESSQSTQITKNCEDEDDLNLKLLQKEKEELEIQLRKIENNSETKDTLLLYEIPCGCKFNDKNSLNHYIKENFSDLKLNEAESNKIYLKYFFRC
jgi:hypothetical protein